MIKNIRKFIADMDKLSLFLTIALFGFGLFSIVSASTREAVNNLDQSVYYYFYRQVAILSISVIIYIFILCIPTNKYKKTWVFFLWSVVLALNAFLVVRGTVTRGANNWIHIPGIPFSIQPGELAKPTMILMISLMIEQLTKYLRNPKLKHWLGIGILLLMGLTTSFFIILQKDMGTALINIGIFGVLFLASPIVKKEKIQVIGAGVIGLALVIIMASVLNVELISSEQKSRMTNYWDPCNESKRNNDGYQICNAYIAINLGGLKGVGISKSTQKYSYIPEPHTDMIFSIIAEEDGFLVGSAIIIAYIILISRILLLSSRAMRISSKYICLGVGTYIFLHVLINLGGLFGLLPLTGVPLPFMSYGGSFTIMLVVCLAIVQRIHVETKRYRLKF